MTRRLKGQPRLWLTVKDCENIFNLFLEKIQFDEPIPPFNSRFEGKLEGIINSVRQTYRGVYLNPTILDASAAYFNQLVRGHAFQNGNKRLAVLYTHIFLLLHKVDIKISDKGLYNFAVFIARAAEQQVSAETTKDVCRKIIEKYSVDWE